MIDCEAVLDIHLAALEGHLAEETKALNEYRVNLQLECRHPRIMETPPYGLNFRTYRACCVCRLGEIGTTEHSRMGDLPFTLLNNQDGRTVESASWLDVHTYRTALVLDHHKRDIAEGKTTLKEVLTNN